MYHVDPFTIERTWSMRHIITAMRVIAMRRAAEKRYADEWQERFGSK